MDKIAVRCDTDEQSKIVIDWTFDNKLTTLSTRYIQKAPTKICIKDINSWGVGCHAENDYWEKHKYIIISYQDFERDYLNKSKEIELIEGNWYEITSADRWLYKYEKNGKSSEGEGKKTEFSKCINTRNKEKYLSNFVTNKLVSPKPANLEEVYKFFPEERPKVNRNTNFVFIPGNIYVGSWGNSRVIFKPSTNSLDDYSSLINVNNEFKTNQRYICTGTSISFREADNDEKQWLNACIKANKFIPKEEVLKSSVTSDFPKEGKCSNKDERLLTYLDRKEILGTNTKYNSKFVAWNSTNYWFCAESSDKPEYTIDQLEKFLPKEEKWIPKIGDWVTLDSTPHAGYNIGDLAQIHNIVNEYDFKVLEKGKSTVCPGNASFKFWHKSTSEEIARYTKKEQPMNTYGLKVGDKLNNEAITQWGQLGNNEYQLNSWKKASSTPYGGERLIKKFEILDGIVGFMPSGVDLYLKAEGFKEFMDNFNKPKVVEPVKQELTSLPEKWCIRRDSSNYKIINKWFKDNNYGNPHRDVDLIRIKPDEREYNSNPSGWEGYTEITYDQFLKWIVKEEKPMEKQEFSIGDEVEIVNTTYFANCKPASIPSEMIKHGMAPVKGDKGKITGFYDKYILVEYGIYSKTIMGFEKESLKKISKEEENLVGRWLKATVDNPQSTDLKKGDYIKILNKIGDFHWRLEREWQYTTSLKPGYPNGHHFELMPIGFTPPSKSDIPEYVECIKLITQWLDIGKIYQCKVENGTFFWKYEGKEGKTNWDSYKGSNDITAKGGFKPSTKESYEAQNKPVMETFKIGDKVECTLERDHIKPGDRGVVMHILGNEIGIEWEKSGGHNCSGKCKQGYGWYVYTRHIKFISSTSKDDLLAEAKRRYLPGMKIVCPWKGGEKVIINSTDFKYDPSGPQIWPSQENFYLYYHGKWAEIPKENKLEVFPGIFVGDIVVRTPYGGEWGPINVGDLVNVNSKSEKNILRTDAKESGYSDQERNWRKATFEEVEAYKKGIRNIKDIPTGNLSGIGKYEPGAVVRGKWYPIDGLPTKIMEIDTSSNMITFIGDDSNKYVGGIDPYRQSIDLLLPEENGLIDTELRKTKSIKTELINQEETILF